MHQLPMSTYLNSRQQPRTGGLDLDIAKTLVQKHPALPLSHHGIRTAKLGLEVMISALLDLSHENGFVKYDAFAPTIQIKSFDHSHIIYQYNPFRDPGNRRATGQPLKTTSGKKVDFLAWETFPKNEHYLIWQAESGNQYGLLVQPAPIVPGHLIISSLNKDKDCQCHYPQVMTFNLMKDMHELQYRLALIGYAMGYNAWGAGASVDHFHTQAVPAAYLPIILAVNGDHIPYSYQGQDKHGVILAIVNAHQKDKNRTHYPVNGVLLKSYERALLYERKKQLLDYMNRREWRFNMISWTQPSGMSVELFYPRQSESIMNQAFKAGYVEMSGMLVIPNKALFESISEAAVGEVALQEASMTTKEFNHLQDYLKPIFDQPNE